MGAAFPDETAFRLRQKAGALFLWGGNVFCGAAGRFSCGAPCGRRRAGNRFFARLPGHWGGALAFGARREISAPDAAGRGGIFGPFFVYCAYCGFLLAKFRRKLKRLSIADRYSAF